MNWRCDKRPSGSESTPWKYQNYLCFLLIGQNRPMPRPDSENREDREEDSATSISDDQVCQNYGQTVYMLAGSTHGSDQTSSTFFRCTNAAVEERERIHRVPEIPYLLIMEELVLK